MSPRITIPTKLALAATPLVLAVGGLLTTTVRSTLRDASQQDHAANVARVWEPTLNILTDLEQEHIVAEGSPADVTAIRAKTDADRTLLQTAIAKIDSPQQLIAGQARFTALLMKARESADSTDPAVKVLAIDQTFAANEALLKMAGLLASEAGQTSAGRHLEALTAFNTMQVNIEILRNSVGDNPTHTIGSRSLITSRIAATYSEMENFKAVATDVVAKDWTAADAEAKITEFLTEASALAAIPEGQPAPSFSAEESTMMEAATDTLKALRYQLADSTVKVEKDKAADTQSSVLTKLALPIIATLLGFALAYLVGRSILRRIRLVTARATEVAEVELPKLVTALRDPSGLAALPEVEPIRGAGTDEVGDIANSFSAVQATLVGVASEQMNVLRRGVSEIFVTLARRNRSLVDSQLNLLDRLEAEVEDPKILADYYKIDHLATRMRRNTESLLVLANSESRRRSSAPLGIDDVVRAAISEVEDYRRIEVLPMETLAIKGPVVADMSHMLAELLDNAASFSPPNTTVRVAGHFTSNGYLLAVSDVGMGMAPERLESLNTLLENPPIIGLSVEPTLGLSVVSMLARKHGIKVELSATSPGVSATVTIPSELYDRRLSTDNDSNYVSDASWEASLTPESMFGNSGYDSDSATSPFPPANPFPPRDVDTPKSGYSDGAMFGSGFGDDHSSDATGYPEGGFSSRVTPNPFGDPHTFSRPPVGPPVQMPLPQTYSSDELPRRNSTKPQSPPPPPPTQQMDQHTIDHQGSVAISLGAALAQSSTLEMEPQLAPALAPEPMDAEPVQKTNSAGLPIRIPGRAKPKTGDDDRVVGTVQPNKVRSSLSAYTRGAAAAKTTHGFSNSGIDHFGPISDLSQGSK